MEDSLVSQARENVSVSVIIPTYNRAARLSATLAAVVRSDIDPRRLEIIVVDDGSDDDTSRLADMAFPCRFRYLRQANQGDAQARNLGILHCEGEAVIFIDDDITVAPDAIPAMEHALLNGSHRIIVGTLIPAGLSRPGIDPVSAVRQEDDPSAIPFTECQCGIFAIRRADYIELGMMDPLPSSGSSVWCDVELAYRATLRGYAILKSRAAWGTHHDYVDLDFEAYCRRIRRAGAAAVHLFQRHPGLRPHLPMFRDKTPISLGDDPPRLVIRKLLRAGLSTGISIRMMGASAAALKRSGTAVWAQRALERWVVGGHIYRGYRQALSEFGARPLAAVDA
jgi:glycosyltransferase involved in cell wall biosynthesis